MKSIIAAAAAILLATSVQGAFAQDPSGGGSAQPAVVSHIKVLSDKVEDVSSMEAWKNSFIKPGMSEMDKALAIWTTVVKFRHQHNPPNEYVEDDNHVHDPIKDYNVYGYGQCCCASANVEAFARYIGMETRGWGISHHSVPEVKINGKWSMLDGSLVNYFKLPDGSIAGVKEISDSVTEWFKDKPELLDPKTKHPYEDHEHYYKIMRKGQWRQGPTVLRGSVGYDENGWLPAHTHAWGDSLIEFGHGDDINFLFEYGVALGYEVNVQLRPGEKLIRNWSNKDLNINDDNKSSREILKSNPQDPTGDMRCAPKFGDLAEGRAGNGILEYTPPLTSLAATALTYDNLTVAENQLKAVDPSKPATLIIRMPSSYVYLTGKLDLGVSGGTPANVAVSFSDNNGLDWKPLSPLPYVEAFTFSFDLKPLVYRRYDYRLKFELKGPDAKIFALKITHDIQHSQRVLPILDKGDTKISFSSGAQEGTITLEGNLPHNGTNPAAAKNLLFSEFHPTLDNVEPKNFTAHKGAGSVTIPVQTPGDMARIRLGAFYHASRPEDKWTVDVSFDNGKSSAPFVTLAGPNIGDSKYVTFDKVPANSRKALVRLTSNAAADQSLWLQQLRIDADYREPHGGFAPVKVIYAYEENGEKKTNTHIARSADETYTIHCETKPKMKSITLELAQ